VVDREGRRDRIEIPAGHLAFTWMGVPIVYGQGDKPSIVVHGADGSRSTVDADRLDRATSKRLIGRDGSIARLDVAIRTSDLLTSICS